MADEKPAVKSFNAEKDLDTQQRADFLFVQKRIPQLQMGRMNHFGHNLESIWAEADRDYIPHRLNTKSKRVVATDEDKGWRGNLVTLGSSDWQSDVSQSNVFTKIQVALSILIDQNPSGVFSPISKKYQATTEIVRQLYQRSWEVAKSKAQLKLFIFNLAKYGWAVGRTYPLYLTRTVKVIDHYDQEDPEKTTYTEKEVVEYNDVMRENLDPRNVWIDDMAKPNQSRTVKDWAWRKVYELAAFKEEFAKYKRVELVTAGGNVQDVVGPSLTSTNRQGAEKGVTSTDLVEVLFFESLQKDLFMMVANGVPVIIEPLPVSDVKGLKKLSVWQTYWNLRHTESPYGVGIYEAIRYDQAVLDRFRNMTIDQITLSIYKMFFYQGTNALSDTGDIVIVPGKGKQVLDPKNIQWMDVPGPGKDSYMGIEMLRRDVDESSGITDPLLGQVTGKTAFEIAQAKESALKRMKNPLDNILDALNEEGYITIALIQLLYSIPETHDIADPNLIEDYLQEIQGDPELYNRTPQVDQQGQPMADKFTAHVYREFPLNLSKDEKGNLIENQDTAFFRVKPGALHWEGVINIKAQSLLSPSKQVEKALELEMYSTLTPMLEQTSMEYAQRQQMGVPVSIDDLTLGKSIKNLIKLYDKDPRDVIPDTWLKPPQAQPSPQLFLPANAPGATANPNPSFAMPPSNGASQASPIATQRPQSFVGKIASRITSPFRGA